MDERNLITGLPIEKADDSKELNVITGVSQDVKDDGEPMGDRPLEKSGEAKWPSISDIDKRSEESDDDEESESNELNKSSDEQPWPSLLQHLVGNVSKGERQGFEKSISMNIPILAIEKKGDEHIVYGIVYEPDTVDAQGDSASAEEIEKAAQDFMENVQTFKIMHKGKPVNIKVLQSFVAPVDYTINKRKVKKGSWVLVTRVLDKQLWKDIKAGKFTGYSMAGSAKVE